MKKRIDIILFIVVGTIATMLAFVGGLNVIKFLMDNPIILAIVFIITIAIEIKDYLKNY